MPRPYGEHGSDGRHQDPEGSNLEADRRFGRPDRPDQASARRFAPRHQRHRGDRDGRRRHRHAGTVQVRISRRETRTARSSANIARWACVPIRWKKPASTASTSRISRPACNSPSPPAKAGRYRHCAPFPGSPAFRGNDVISRSSQNAVANSATAADASAIPRPRHESDIVDVAPVVAAPVRDFGNTEQRRRLRSRSTAWTLALPRILRKQGPFPERGAPYAFVLTGCKCRRPDRRSRHPRWQQIDAHAGHGAHRGYA